MDIESKDYQMEIHHLNLHHSLSHNILSNQELQTSAVEATKMLDYASINVVENLNTRQLQAENEPTFHSTAADSVAVSSHSTASASTSTTLSSSSSSVSQSANSSQHSGKKSNNSVDTSEVPAASIRPCPSTTTTQPQKFSCCVIIPTLATSSTTTPTPSSTTALLSSELTREHWYSHPHHTHHHAHPHSHPHPHHQQLVEELAVYSTPSTAQISKFGFDSTAEGYLNSRYNVKGVRTERASSFFDIPAVTHPYCYRFPPSPPAGILKKNDEESSFCNNNAASAALQISHHFHNARIMEHPDSTTHLSHHHHHQHHHHHPTHHTHQQGQLHHNHNPHHQQQQQQHIHSPHHTTSLKLSPSSPLPTTITSCTDAATVAAVYHHYNASTNSTGYSIRPSSEITTSSETDIKYESPFNPVISSSYALRPNLVDSTTVTSTDAELKFENPYSSNGPISTSQTVSHRRGSLQLWQFLVALLDEPTTSSSCIAWTGRGMEFKLIEPEEVARRWGMQKNRPAMNYDKLSRSLRYYYEKGIMQKVNGERYVYRFVCDPDALFNMAYGHLNNAANTTKAEHNHYISATASLSASKSTSSNALMN